MTVRSKVLIKGVEGAAIAPGNNRWGRATSRAGVVAKIAKILVCMNTTITFIYHWKINADCNETNHIGIAALHQNVWPINQFYLFTSNFLNK